MPAVYFPLSTAKSKTRQFNIELLAALGCKAARAQAVPPSGRDPPVLTHQRRPITWPWNERNGWPFGGGWSVAATVSNECLPLDHFRIMNVSHRWRYMRINKQTQAIFERQPTAAAVVKKQMIFHSHSGYCFKEMKCAHHLLQHWSVTLQRLTTHQLIHSVTHQVAAICDLKPCRCLSPLTPHPSPLPPRSCI